ncbi:MAG: ribosome-associated translation inhibitor RaiA [Deltaproteobacteria bacterium]|nr:ribosome-associated translation inhibitor RaiA [Deltaproteobacteria bacterium]
MHVDITFRHMEATPALREHAEEKTALLARYFSAPMSARWVFDVRHGTHHAEVSMSGGGENFFSEEKSDSLYKSIDVAAHRLETQVRKVHDKRNHHRPH